MPKFQVRVTEEHIWVYRVEAEHPDVAYDTIKHLRLTSNPIPPSYKQDITEVYDEDGNDIDWSVYEKEDENA